MRTILSRALAELNAHRSVVLVTIVAEQGSAPANLFDLSP